MASTSDSLSAPLRTLRAQVSPIISTRLTQAHVFLQQSMVGSWDYTDGSVRSKRSRRRGSITLNALPLSIPLIEEAGVLSILSRLNALTTIVSRFPRDDEDEFGVHVTTWQHHPAHRTQSCDWTLVPPNQSSGNEEETHISGTEATYAWEYQRERRHQHQGTSEATESFSVVCRSRSLESQLLFSSSDSPILGHTRNAARFIVVDERSVRVVISGTATLRVVGTSDSSFWK
jgi:hypothetical protein